MKSEMFQRLKSVPPIVRIIISEATKRRAARDITEDHFATQMDRLELEELEPRGLTLLMRELPRGRSRFIVKEKATGATCDMLDFASDGTPETDTIYHQSIVNSS